MSEIRIVDTTGKKSINCSNCGSSIDIPPRTINIEKLHHMQEVKSFSEWHRKHITPKSGSYGLGNVRLLICLNCGQPHICTDQFSIDTRKMKGFE